jgi:pyruvate kinase
MALPNNKTKIVATIGPASESPEMLERIIRAGLNVARVNFSHGDLADHAERINRIRSAAEAAGRRVAIMADLPGPKIRIGKIEPEPIQLHPGENFILTADVVSGNAERVSVTLAQLPRVVKPGDKLFLNDGLVQLTVQHVSGAEVHCKVAVGGELRSKKGLNLPGVALGISAFTDHDRACLKFALEHGVDAVSQSFVETRDDMEAVRAAAEAVGKRPFLVAKIERLDAIRDFDEIVNASDGIMIARGDLGVEVPIEEMAMLQKQLIARAHIAGKPVITATHMLESMTDTRLPTRAEATGQRATFNSRRQREWSRYWPNETSNYFSVLRSSDRARSRASGPTYSPCRRMAQQAPDSLLERRDDSSTRGARELQWRPTAVTRFAVSIPRGLQGRS